MTLIPPSLSRLQRLKSEASVAKEQQERERILQWQNQRQDLKQQLLSNNYHRSTQYAKKASIRFCEEMINSLRGRRTRMVEFGGSFEDLRRDGI